MNAVAHGLINSWMVIQSPMFSYKISTMLPSKPLTSLPSSQHTTWVLFSMAIPAGGQAHIPLPYPLPTFLSSWVFWSSRKMIIENDPFSVVFARVNVPEMASQEEALLADHFILGSNESKAVVTLHTSIPCHQWGGTMKAIWRQWGETGYRHVKCRE